MRFRVTVTVDSSDYEGLESALSSLSAVGGAIEEIRVFNDDQWNLVPIPARYSPEQKHIG